MQVLFMVTASEARHLGSNIFNQKKGWWHMRNAFALALVFVVLVALVASPVLADCGKDCRCKHCTKRCDKEITEFIYDITIPWPFRHKAGDLDGDGVADNKDKCPGTPAGVAVDAYGCPLTDKRSELLNTGMIRTSQILFEKDKADIKPESYPVLADIGEILVEWPHLKVEVGGHSDAAGDADYNEELSEERAKTVLIYLTQKFPAIEWEQFTAKGYGESMPIASNDTDEGRAKNRRVEFKVLNAEDLKK